MDHSPVDYSKLLRVVGQVLEPFHPKAYDIVCYNHCYLIRCRTTESEDNKKKIRSLAAFLRLWRHEEEQPSVPDGPNRRPQMNVELLYSLEDLTALDEEGKARRRKFNGMPEPYSLSTVLRGAGAYLNRKRNPQLLLASNHDHTVVILYQTSQGARKVEEYSVPLLYDLCVKNYVKRQHYSKAG